MEGGEGGKRREEGRVEVWRDKQVTVHAVLLVHLLSAVSAAVPE